MHNTDIIPQNTGANPWVTAPEWAATPDEISQDVMTAWVRAGVLNYNDIAVYRYMHKVRDYRSQTTFVGRETIADQTGLGTATVARRIDALRRAGLLTKLGEMPSHGTRRGSSIHAVHNAVLALDVDDIRLPDGSPATPGYAGAELSYRYGIDRGYEVATNILFLRGAARHDYARRYAMDRARTRAAALGLDPDSYEADHVHRNPSERRTALPPGAAQTEYERIQAGRFRPHHAEAPCEATVPNDGVQAQDIPYTIIDCVAPAQAPDSYAMDLDGADVVIPWAGSWAGDDDTGTCSDWGQSIAANVEDLRYAV